MARRIEFESFCDVVLCGVEIQKSFFGIPANFAHGFRLAKVQFNCIGKELRAFRWNQISGLAMKDEFGYPADIRSNIGLFQ